jgi:hypothetical protein
VRCKAAEHPNMPAKTLEKLAVDESACIREVANNPSASAETLEKLAYDKNIVRRRLAAAYREKNSFMRFMEEEHPELLIAQYPDLLLLAGFPDRLHAAHLEKAANDESRRMRAMIVKNPSAPVKILEKLAGDEDEEMRRDVAGNPGTPPKILEKLAGDEKCSVRINALKNPHTPPIDRKKLMNANGGVRLLDGYRW